MEVVHLSEDGVNFCGIEQILELFIQIIDKVNDFLE